MNTKDWNPELYLQFRNERGVPSDDLINSLEDFTPKKIIDIGCGPGNSTLKLAGRWPGSKIYGVDSSEAMIEKAKNTNTDIEWAIKKIGKDKITGKYDLIFSNAVIQWIPDHDKLFREFYNQLNSNGRVAVQIPLFFDMKLGFIIKDVAESPRWNSLVREVTNNFYISEYGDYYDILSRIGYKKIRIWETRYMHIFPSHNSIIEMIRSTGLKPYLEKLDKKNTELFENMVRRKVEESYQVQEDGSVILPFHRLFMIGTRG